MAPSESFEDLCVLVSEASSPDEVFASLRQAETLGWRGALRAEYDKMCALTDPRRFGDEGAREAAEIVRKRLDELYDEAVREREEGVTRGEQAPTTPYRQAAPLGRDEQRFSVRTGRGAYEVTGVLARGNVATLYEGRGTEGPRLGRSVVLKLADDPADNDLMLDEVAALEKLTAAGGPQRKHLPELIDHFRAPDGRVGVVLERLDALDLLDLRQRVPRGVPPQHAIWMLRRLFSVLGYVHNQGIVHGNIEPSHVMVRPRDHNVFLVDWCYSIIEPAKTGRGFKVETPSYSPPEVGQRKPPLPASDLYSVGKCAAFLLGAEPGSDAPPAGTDERLARFIRYLTRPSPLQRAQDAWDMFDELGKIRRALFGPHRFQEFII